MRRALLLQFHTDFRPHRSLIPLYTPIRQWAKEVPLNNKFQIGVTTVVLLVVLRVVLGWHFLYEGVWKIKNPEKFAIEAEGFLTGARGPLAPLFHAMIPDLDGRQRLQADLTRETVKDAKGKEKEILKDESLENRWDGLRQQFVDYYYPGAKDEILLAKHGKLADQAKKTYERHVAGLQAYLTEKAPEFDAYFAALDRYQEGKKKDPNTSFQTQRRWDEMQQLRREVKQWLTELDDREKAFRNDLLSLVAAPAKARLEPVKGADRKPAKTEAAKGSASKAASRDDDRSRPWAPVVLTAETKEPTDAAKTEVKTEAKPESKTEAKLEAKTPDQPETKTEAKTETKAEAKPDAKTEAQPELKEEAKPETKTAAKTVAKTEKKEAAKAAPAAPRDDFSDLAEKRKGGNPFPASMNPFQWKRIDQIAFALTWGLTAMGLCLMLGLFTRPAALAGGVFMLFVVMSQPSFPGVYPPDPPQLGHALLVNKDFVEMIALFVIATTAVGRWAGLDFFLDNFVINPFLSKTIYRKKNEG